MIDAGAAVSGAQGLRPFRPETVHRTVSMTVFTPFAASVRMSLSRVRSDTARLSRSFSFFDWGKLCHPRPFPDQSSI